MGQPNIIENSLGVIQSTLNFKCYLCPHLHHPCVASTATVKNQVKKIKSELAIILTNKRTPTAGHWCKQGVQSEIASGLGATNDRRRTHLHQDGEAAPGELRHQLQLDCGCLGSGIYFNCCLSFRESQHHC